MKNKIIIGLIIAFLGIQFISSKVNNETIWDTENDITVSLNTSDEVKQIIETSCADCHSNKTTYPWYSNIQPIGFWLQHHVKEGKVELNFTTFNKYSLKRKKHKLKEIGEMLEENEMPLPAYTLIHSNAKLTAEQKELLLNWANQSLTDSITSN